MLTARKGKTRRVLIVDDDEDLCALLGAALHKHGYEFLAVHSLADASKAIEAEYFPLVLLDRHLPDGDGVRLPPELRANSARPYSVIVMVTARGGAESYLQCMDAGADDFLPKPIDLDVLGARLRAFERLLSLQGEVGQLRAFLPICMHCHKVRDESGHWASVEDYVRQRSAAHFSHGICEACYESEYGETP